MAGPGTPGSEGPTFPPPTLPRGWVAQWDASSKKYYFVQLATGVSQWDTPTDAAPVGGGNTPANVVDHPYGAPRGNPEVITHPDGSQTVKHADGTMEPILPQDGSRGVGGDGPQGERGIGTFLMNQIGGSHGGQSHGAGGLAGQLISGLTHAGGSSGHHSGGASSGIGGKLASQLASNLFHSSDKPPAPQNYHGGPNAQTTNSGGLAGSVMGGVAHMFGGKPTGSSQNFGYSNSGQSGGYSGSAPPTTYQTPTSGSSSYQSPPAQHSTTPSYQSPPPSQPPAQSYGQQAQGHNAPYGQPTPPSFQGPPGSQSHTPSYQPPPGQQSHTPSYPPPPGQQHYGQSNPPASQPNYGAPASQPSYGTPQGQHQQGYGQSQYGAQGSYNPPYANIPPPPPAGHSSYPPQQSYGQNYGSQNPPY